MDNMDNKLILIFQSIQTIHGLEDEFSKKFGLLKFKEKREYKKLKSNVVDIINSLKDEKWTIRYLFNMQNTLYAFYDNLEKYMTDMYIPSYDQKTNIQSTFNPMYFVDQKNKNRLIILEIVSDNISFRVMDTENGHTFEISASDEVQQSQKKMESICKETLIYTIINYLVKK